MAGLDDEGVGCVYGYDAVGSFERSKYVTEGSGVSLIQPLLDNQVKFANQPEEAFVQYTCDETVDLIKDAFTSAGERVSCSHIHGSLLRCFAADLSHCLAGHFHWRFS